MTSGVSDLRMRPVRLLIFDLDGTLVNTLEDITASVNFTLSRLGRPLLPMDTVRQYVGDGITTLLTRALGDHVELIDDAVGIYTVHHSKNLVVRSRLYPGVRETLEHFQAIPLAVLSNKADDLVKPLLERLAIAGYFKAVVGADAGLPLKPAPDAVLRVVSDFGAPKERSAIVGDGATDIRAGKAAGVITCAVTYGFRSGEELRAEGPDLVIHEFPELERIFQPELPA